MKSKKVISFLIVLIIMMQPLAAFSATNEQTYAANQLLTLGIITGYEDGTLRLENNITRAELATIMVRTLGYEDKIIISNNTTDFSDVDNSFWAYQHIKNAASLGLITGYPDGTFKPNQNINYGEMITIMIRAFGAKADTTIPWPDNYIVKAKEMALIKDEDTSPSYIVKRSDVFEYLWRLLLIKS